MLSLLAMIALVTSCGDEGGATENKWTWIEEIPSGVSALSFDRQGTPIMAAGGPKFGERMLFHFRDGALDRSDPPLTFSHFELLFYRSGEQLYGLSFQRNIIWRLASSGGSSWSQLEPPTLDPPITIIAAAEGDLLLGMVRVPDTVYQAELAYWRPGEQGWTIIPGSQHFAQSSRPYPVTFSPEGKIVLLSWGAGELDQHIFVGDTRGVEQINHDFYLHDNWQISRLAGAPNGDAYLLRPGKETPRRTKSVLFHVSQRGELSAVAELPEPYVRPVGLSIAPSGEVFAFLVKDNSPEVAAIFRYKPADRSLTLVKKPEGYNAYWSYVAYDADTIYKFGEANSPSDGYGVWRLKL